MLSPVRLIVAAALAAAAAGVAVSQTAVPAAVAKADRPPFDDAGYLAYMDRMQERLDMLWDERSGRYLPGRGGTDTTVNANLLLAHSVAALTGHEGPSRNDHRARALVRALLHSPPYVTRPVAHGADSQLHAPGWADSMDRSAADQHVMIDAEVVDGLQYAWLARHRLGLGDGTARAIATAIHSVARGAFWRYPSIRLNQINWYALIYAADATVTGDGELLRRDLRKQIARFAGGQRRTRGEAGNFGGGLRFHYFPRRRAGEPRNIDSAEYANIVASFTRFYVQARRAGMRPPAPAQRRLLGAWLTRVLAGYWTHSGYLNWDSGLGFHRWHQSKKLGLSQQALIGIATAKPLLPDRRYAAYAKWILDRGLDFYERQATRNRGLAPGLFFGVDVIPQALPSARLAAAREESNAARALQAGLGRARALEPPPLYAFDPDVGRLAVTTPSYNTAIVAVSQRAFPYGGIELARLFDSDQDVAADIGGRPPASFGLLVRDRSGRRLLATQLPRMRVERRVTPLRLLRAPAGRTATASSRPTRAYAGAFRELRVDGGVRAPGLRTHTRHRFTSRYIETRWTLRAHRRGGLDVDVLFPSWHRRATVTAVLDDGRRVTIGAARRPIGDIAWLWLHNARTGYVVVPRRGPDGTTARLIYPRRQPAAPDPGPTLALALADGEHVHHTGLTARLAPARNPREAADVAALLRVG